MLRLLASLLTLFALAGVPAAAQPYDAGRATVELISEREVAMPGETVYLALDKTMDEGWHVYWRNAGDAGLPPQILWEQSPLGEVTEGTDFAWPLPRLLPVDETIMDYGYDDRLTLPFAFTVPEDASGPITFRGTADYLICKDVCIPETAPVRFTLEVGEAQVPDTGSAAKIADALARVPAPFEGEAVAVPGEDGTLTLSMAPAQAARFEGASLRFFPYEHTIVHSAEQRISSGSEGASLTMTAEPRAEPGETLDGVIAVTAADGTRTGFALSARPAEAPLPGTYGRAPATGSIGIGLVSLVGLALLGGLILNLMPCVLPVLSIKANGLLHAAQSGSAGHFRAHGLWYTAGVLAAFGALALAFVGLRSIGQFWALGSLLQYPVVVAGLALAAFTLGLWLLGMFELGGSLQNLGSKTAASGGNLGAFATGALAATAGAPCVGPFVAAPLGATLNSPAWEVIVVYLALGLGLALPFLALSFFPGLARRLPRPGPWMERVKQFFAFPMFLTAAALLVVLGDQAGSGAVGWVVAGAALIGFGIWALKAAGGRVRTAALGLGAIAVLGGLALPLYAAATSSPPGDGATTYAAKYQTEPWSPERVDELVAEGRGVFVDFTATWCMICQANKRSTLTRPEVLEAMADADIAFLVADFTNKDPVIAAELERLGRPGIPVYLLYPPGDPEPKILPVTLTPGIMLREIDAATSS